MTKLYSFIEHSFAVYSNLKVEISSVKGEAITKEFEGFQSVLGFLKSVLKKYNN